ncbi:MAG: NAD(P)-dependent oxidoreductase [Fibrobacteria bacterium]|nr:NAD(P)-dependent oxidoreductase [Fibrobacteria bacterium]
MTRVLLTGAAGFIGRNLLGAEGARAFDWIALDRAFPDGGPGGIVDRVVDPMEDPASLAEVVRRTRPDAVVHLAGWLGKGGTPENRTRLLQANLGSTWNLLDALALGGRREVPFLLASSALVYGDREGPFREDMECRPVDEYGMSKFLAEEAVRCHGRRGVVAPCVLRPAVVYGPGQTGGMFVPALASALSRGERFPMTAGAQKRDLIHVRDLCDAILALVSQSRSGTFNVGTGNGVSMLEIGRILAAMAGRSDLLGVGEIPYRESEVWEYAVDSSALREQVGWRPRIELQDGLRETLDKELGT